MNQLNEIFRKMSAVLSAWMGTAYAFLASVLLVVAWAGFGPYFKWSDSHSLFINSLTTVITFWMVFVIQNTQNRNSKEVQLKLDEIIRALGKARNKFIDLEHLSDKQLKVLERDIKEICGKSNKCKTK